MITRTIYIDLEKLNRNNKLATLIPRLMMACNDVSFSNACLAEYKDKKDTKNRYNIGACMYFFRLQIGHIEEGLKIIGEIRKDFRLSQVVNVMSQDGKKSFHKLCNCSDGKDQRWKKYFTPIRQNLSFHYNDKKEGKLTRDALNDRVTKNKQKLSKITVGDIKKMRFELGDEIFDTIVCRNLFGIPYSVDLQKDKTQLHKILDFGSDFGKAFLSFGAEYIYKIAEN